MDFVLSIWDPWDLGRENGVMRRAFLVGNALTWLRQEEGVGK